MEFLTPLLVILGFGGIAFLLSKKSSGIGNAEEVRTLQEQLALLKANLEQKSQEAGKLAQELHEERDRRSEQEGKGKVLYSQFEQMKAELQASVRERQDLQDRITRFESEHQQQQKQFTERLMKLEHAEMSFKKEQERVIQEDIARRAQLEEERDRMWNEHEISVISSLTNLCKEPSYAFRSFDNANLPDDFDGSLKPDFMIEFLDQYVIFDAKVSKAESLQTYINNTVKSTAQKLKKNPKIYPSVFFVVPSAALAELKKTYFSQDGFVFYVIPPEAVPVILSSLKRIATYELAEQLDPQERENIVNLIAEFDYHINLRNAADLFISKLGTSLLERTEQLSPELRDQIELKKRDMKSPFNIAEIKKMILSQTLQNEEIARMVSPKASVKTTFVETVKQEVIQPLL